MEELREALPDHVLKALLEREYDPDDTIRIQGSAKYGNRPSAFVEDLLDSPQPKRARKRVKSKPKNPSEMFGPAYEHFKNEGGDVDAKVVLGCYFIGYLKFFDEEDPEWVAVPTKRAVMHVTNMANALCDGKYEPILEYVRKILPLWAKQMRAGAEFPSVRPSVDTLFLRRRIWSQRHNLYKRWKK
jgi:hypothetical protein